MTVKQILLFIFIVLLFLFLIYPVYTPFYKTIREGASNSFSAVDISNVQQHIDVYDKNTDDGACLTAVKSMKALNFPNTNKMIQSNSELPNCAIIEKIAALNIKNEKVLNIINTCYGQKYSAVLNMITSIKTTDAYTNNSNFSDFINNASNSIAVSGNNATPSKIKTYMDAMGAANQMDSIQKSQTEPEEPVDTTKSATTTKK